MWSDTSYAGEQVLHQRTLTDHAFEPMSAEDFAFQLLGFVPALCFGRQPADAKTEIGDRNGLCQVIAGAFLNRFKG